MIIEQNSQQLDRIAGVIAQGGVIAFRTDTFYGFGADPFNAAAVKKIKKLKGREGNKPILVVISDVDQIHHLIINQSRAFEKLCGKFWPGALTIIGESAAALSDALTAGAETIGVRLPDDDEVRALIRACGGALTGTSANPAGEPPARAAEEVRTYFDDQIDLIVDGGPAKTDRPSTVVDATSDEVKLIREGVISWDEIQAALVR